MGIMRIGSMLKEPLLNLLGGWSVRKVYDPLGVESTLGVCVVVVITPDLVFH